MSIYRTAPDSLLEVRLKDAAGQEIVLPPRPELGWAKCSFKSSVRKKKKTSPGKPGGTVSTQGIEVYEGKIECEFNARDFEKEDLDLLDLLDPAGPKGGGPFLFDCVNKPLGLKAVLITAFEPRGTEMWTDDGKVKFSLSTIQTDWNEQRFGAGSGTGAGGATKLVPLTPEDILRLQALLEIQIQRRSIAQAAFYDGSTQQARDDATKITNDATREILEIQRILNSGVKEVSAPPATETPSNPVDSMAAWVEDTKRKAAGGQAPGQMTPGNTKTGKFNPSAPTAKP